MSDRPIVIVDGMNCWVRYFLGNQEMNADGEPFGGAIGFLRLIRNLFRQFTPSQIFVVWEAGGGSKRRKKILETYKVGKDRSNISTGVFEERSGFQKDLLHDEQLKAKQLLFLNKVLKHLSVRQIYIKDTEGDDVAAFLLSEAFGAGTEYANTLKVVVSNDKDYYQFLTDPNVRIYHPGKKLLYNQDLAQEDCDGIHVMNYCVAKSFVGDKSDNIEGVPGVGYKSLVKYYPALKHSKEILIDDFIKYTEEVYSDFSKTKAMPKVVMSIHNNLELAKRNYKLIYIGNRSLSNNQQDTAMKQIHSPLHSPNLIGFLSIFSENKVNIMQEHEALFSEASLFLRHG